MIRRIVGIHGGAQPMTRADGTLALCIDGETHDHRELAAAMPAPYAFTGGSDCGVINALWRADGPGAVAKLDGILAFARWDSAQHFPGDQCSATVPGGQSITCSSPPAIARDAACTAAADPSGRAIA